MVTAWLSAVYCLATREVRKLPPQTPRPNTLQQVALLPPEPEVSTEQDQEKELEVLGDLLDAINVDEVEVD